MYARHMLSIAALNLFTVSLVIAQAPPASPKPGPEHDKLDFFEGRWTSEAEMKAGPMGPGGTVTGTSSCVWFHGGFYMVCRSDGRGSGGEMHSMDIMGYNPERKQYTFYHIDDSGMGADPIYGNLSGDTWTFEGESMMAGQKWTGRYTMKQLSPDSYSWTFEMAVGEVPMAVVAQGTETRVK